MERDFELNRDAFQQWLEGKPPYDIAGHGTDPECCPIANFLTEVFAQSFAYADAYTFGVGFYNKEPTPSWAKTFMQHIQKYCGRNGEVYVDDCIKIIREHCSEIPESSTGAA